MQNAHRLRKDARKPIGQRGVVCRSTLPLTAAEDISEADRPERQSNDADTTAAGFAGPLPPACQAAEIPPFTLIA